MSTYRCTKDFISMYHMKEYKEGYIILQKEFNDLLSSDQKNFEIVVPQPERISDSIKQGEINEL